MNTEEQLAKLWESNAVMTRAFRDVNDTLTAVTTAFIGVLQALDTKPELVPLIADGISAHSERVAALYLGSPISEEFLSRRTELLQALLPPNVRKLVPLP